MTHDPMTTADYADALVTARKAKGWVFGLLLLALLTQLGSFFTARYSGLIVAAEPVVAAAAATTAPSAPPAPPPAAEPALAGPVEYAVTLAQFSGVSLSIVLCLLLLLISLILLQGRMIGAARAVSSLVWSLVLAVLLFPWQHLLGAGSPGDEWRLPGILYSFPELRALASFGEGASLEQQALHWARFVGFPLLGLVLLVMVQTRSSRAVRAALGEGPGDVEVDSTTL